MVRAICTARLGPREADDTVQEVFLRAFRGLPRLKDPGSFTSYVGQIARNYCVDRLRAAQRNERSLEEIEVEPADPRGEGDTDRELMLEQLRREVGRLPENQRETLMMFYFERMSYAGMATALGISEAAVNQRLSRARAHLRTVFQLTQEGEA